LANLIQLLRIEVVFEAISLVISLFIAAQLFRAYRALGSRGILLLGAGFTLMSAAMLFRVVAVGLSLAAPSEGWRLVPWLTGLIKIEVVYSIVRVAAYVVFIAAYASPRLMASRGVQAAAPLLLVYNPIFELVSAALLVYVVIENAHNWLAGSPRGSAEIFAGFLILLLSHVSTLLAPLGPVFYMLGHALQLSALTSILLGAYEAGSAAR